MREQREASMMADPSGAGSNGAVRDRRVGGTRLPAADGPRTTHHAPLDQPQWIANLQIQRLLSVGMFACVAWALAQALVSAGMAALHALSIGLVATVIYAAGVALGGRTQT